MNPVQYRVVSVDSFPGELDQIQSPLCRLPKEIVLSILSFHPFERSVLNSCKLLYRFGFKHKDPSAHDQKMLNEAAGSTKPWASRVIERLLHHEKIDPAKDKNLAIRRASETGNLNNIKALLADPKNRVNPADNNNSAIIAASERGHSEVVKFLIDDPRIDPCVEQNTPISRASANGHLETVGVLLRNHKVRSSLANSEAMCAAILTGNFKIAKELGISPDVFVDCALRLISKLFKPLLDNPDATAHIIVALVLMYLFLRQENQTP